MLGYVSGILDLVGKLKVGLQDRMAWTTEDAFKLVQTLAIDAMKEKAKQLELNLEKGEMDEG